MANLVGALAAGIGYFARFVLSLVRLAAWLSGPLLVVYGVLLIYRPAAYIVAGLIVFAFLSYRPRLSRGSQ